MVLLWISPSRDVADGQLVTAFAYAMKVWDTKTSTASYPQMQTVRSQISQTVVLEYRNILKIEFIN